MIEETAELRLPRADDDVSMLKLYGSVIRGMSEGVVVHDVDGAILAANASAEHILGLTAAQMKGLSPLDPYWKLYRRDGEPATQDDIPSETARLTGRDCRNAVLRLQRRVDESVWLRINATVVSSDESGNPKLVVATFNDVTSELEATDELLASRRQLQESNAALIESARRLEARNQEYRAALERAEASNIAKTQFLANMSHELRTPLNAVIGFAEFILSWPDSLTSGRLREYVRDIRDAGRQLLAIVNDILDVSRLELGALEPDLRSIDVVGAVGEAVKVCRARALEKKISLRVNPATRPIVAVCDLRLIRQALINVLINAIKFSPAGSHITMTVAAAEAAVTIEVFDEGPGFTQSGLAAAFEPFWQEDGNAQSAASGGVGLGLAIAKRYVEASGGTITAENGPGGGAHVSIRLRCD